MDLCRNVSVSGGLPSEYHQPEQLLSSSCSKLSSLDDLFSTHNTEARDVGLEWLSVYVEDCFSSSGINCLLPAAAAVPTITNELQKNTSTTANNNNMATPSASKVKPLQYLEKTQVQLQVQNTTTCLQKKFLIPGKARSKRKRGPVVTRPKTQQVTSWSHHYMTSSSDPPLLQQAYWLADSELILPPKKEDISTTSRSSKGRDTSGEHEEEVVEENRGSLEGKNGQQQQQQQARRCSHCLVQKTPQWRAGPLGPKTLCNACGVRYKSGRLLPEYRPAKSPTFVSYKHSNSHKKVMEMRMAVLSSIPTSHH